MGKDCNSGGFCHKKRGKSIIKKMGRQKGFCEKIIKKKKKTRYPTTQRKKGKFLRGGVVGENGGTKKKREIQGTKKKKLYRQRVREKLT